MVKTYESIREKAATRVQPVHAFPPAFRPSEVVDTLKGDAFIYAALSSFVFWGVGSRAPCFPRLLFRMLFRASRAMCWQEESFQPGAVLGHFHPCVGGTLAN